MKYEELAFFNQQLGTMLANGVPLEGALEQLCQNLQQGSLRGEMEQLATDPEKRHTARCRAGRAKSPAVL